MGCTVGKDQAVDAEILVIDRVAEITTVGPVFNTIFIDLSDTLVDPVPNKAALQTVVAFDGFPILLEIADAVAHGVGIFAHDKGPVVGFIFGISDDFCDLRVHRAAQVSGDMTTLPILGTHTDGTFVVNDTIGVIAANKTSHRVVVGAVAALVAQRPDDDAGVIFVAFDHTDAAFHKGIQPFSFMGQDIIDRVGLQVGFIPDIQPDLVADIIKGGIVWIMGGAHGVHIVTLHHQHIGKHIFIRDILTMLVVMIVTVGPFDIDHLTVD